MSENDEIYENSEQTESDEQFFERADEFIGLANQLIDSSHQVSHLTTEPGKVSASFMWALARYNAWFGSTSFENKEQMQAKKQEMMDYYMERYKEMLDANLEDYIENFDHYRATQK